MCGWWCLCAGELDLRVLVLVWLRALLWEWLMVFRLLGLESLLLRAQSMVLPRLQHLLVPDLL